MGRHLSAGMFSARMHALRKEARLKREAARVATLDNSPEPETDAERNARLAIEKHFSAIRYKRP